MFGLISKRKVLEIIQREIDIDEKMEDRYRKYVTDETGLSKGCKTVADEYFYRMLQAKELKVLIESM